MTTETAARHQVLVFDGSEFPMFVFERLSGRILDSNDTAETVYGMSGEMLRKMVVDDLRDRTQAANGDRVRRHRRADGESFESQEIVYDIVYGGMPAGLLVVEDVSERAKWETQESQSQRLETLGQLAGGVAHDFNNILGAILNYASFVREEIDDAVERGDAVGDRWTDVLFDVRKIAEAAESAAWMTRRLLAFARREVIQPRVINVHRVVANVEELLRRTLGEHIDLVLTTDRDLRNVKADPGQLEQVVLNLAVNSRDAMPSGGSLSIDTTNTEVDDAETGVLAGIEPGSYVRITITDTGKGMEPAIVEHAFEPFFTTKAKSGGTGLGLATVYGSVTQAGGTVRIRSEVGTGTEVAVYLPATDEEAPEVEGPPPVAKYANRCRTLLVVEDDDAVRDVAQRILVRNGFDVVLATGGEEAMEIIDKRSAIDLLLTDVVMPQIMGSEVAAYFSEKHPGSPVVFMSGHAQPILGSIVGAEVNLIEKPFNEATLVAKIDDAFGHSSPVEKANREP